MATLALFVALGGSSYAVSRIGSEQIVNNSVRSRDIRNNDIRGTDVRNRSLLERDFKRGQLPAGPPGPQGPKGDTGRTGPPGPTYFARVRGTDGALVDGTATSSTLIPGDFYEVTFGRAIDRCAATANSAVFPGSTGAVENAVANVRIGQRATGAADARVVSLNFWGPGSGTATSFTLVVACP